MRSDLLHVVTCVSNPLRWQSRIALYETFCQHMLDSGVNLTTVECALGQRPFELSKVGAPHVNYVPVRHTTIVWHKESLLNIGFSRLPRDAAYVAWIDADVTFRDPNWAAETVHALQQYAVVQPWQNCYDLGPRGEHLELHTSFCSLVQEGKPITPKWNQYHTFGHPGYAWAMRRETLANLGGLYAAAALGSADHNMALAMLGRVNETFPSDISPTFTQTMAAWQARAIEFVGQRIGFVPGTIEHGFHGPKASRNYVSRWDILRKSKFDPLTDLKPNLDGVIELSGSKKGLQRDIEAYFRARDEDSNRPRA